MENKKAENTIIKDAIALFLITLIAGLCLGLVYEVTKDPIQKVKDEAKAESYQSVFENASAFRDEEGKFEDVEDTSTATLSSAGISAVTINEVLEAQNESGEIVGYVMSITSTEGYGGALKIAVGIDAEGTITGVDTLELNETAGLGARAAEDEFKGQYKGKNVEEFTVSKAGASSDNEINAISGATITSNAVTKAVNAGIYYAKNCINN